MRIYTDFRLLLLSPTENVGGDGLPVLVVQAQRGGQLRLTLVVCAAVLLEGDLELLAGLILVQDRELIDVGYPAPCRNKKESIPGSAKYLGDQFSSRHFLG